MKMKMKGIMAVAVLAATVASAVDWTEWTTTGTGDWFNASNWGSGVPGSSVYPWFVNNGTANIASAGAVCWELHLGYSTVGGGTINVSGAGTLDIGSYTYIVRSGDSGDTSTLNITGGGDVTSASGMYVNYLEAGGGGTAVVNVDGSGSTWTTKGAFDMGRYGSTTMNIKNGGAVSHDNVGSITMATFPGSDSSLSITSGGTLTNASANLVVGSGGTGTLTVDGGGSSLTSAGSLIVGNYGDGTADVTGGATVGIDLTTRIGFRDGSTGVLTVSGAGSFLNTAALDVGLLTGSSGILNISDGGLVAAETLVTASDATLGVVQMGLDGELALLGDGSANINAFLGLVGESDNIDYWNGSAWADIITGTEGVDYTLSLISGGDLDGYTSLTVIPEPGTLGLLLVSSVGFLATRRMRRK